MREPKDEDLDELLRDKRLRRGERLSAPRSAVPETMERTDFFFCSAHQLAMTAGVCDVRQRVVRSDGSSYRPCSVLATDGRTKCAQGRLVLVALGKIRNARLELAEDIPASSVAERIVIADLPDLTKPEPPPQPPAQPPADYAQKVKTKAPAPIPAPVPVPSEKKTRAVSGPREETWRAAQAEGTRRAKKEKLDRLFAAREAWIASGRSTPPPKGICDQPGCKSLLRSDSVGTTCSFCRQTTKKSRPQAPALP